MKLWQRCSWFVIAGFAFAGCERSQPKVIYMPDMVYSPALKAQKEGAMRMPVPGTVPVDFIPYPYKNDPEGAGRELKNPFRPTLDVLQRGKQVYMSNCYPCHGNGLGDGPIIPKFPRPASLLSEKVRNWPDGSLFHVITMGQNLMPSYATQVAEKDRWKAIHYVRVLQRSKHPTAEDLKLLKEESK